MLMLVKKKASKKFCFPNSIKSNTFFNQSCYCLLQILAISSETEEEFHLTACFIQLS